jgi:hypothetical protein
MRFPCWKDSPRASNISFLGDHALGGSRFTLEKTRLWYERLYRLLPDISFDLRAIHGT